VVTKTLKLATGVCLVVQRDPIQTAKLVASIDQVFRRAFLFAFGGGWNREGDRGHGAAFATRFKLDARADRGDDGDLTQSKPEYHGEFVDFAPMMSWPKPVQKPHPPIIVGGPFSAAARRAAGRYGDGWVHG